MNDILYDLKMASLRGLAPPPSWATRAEAEIERLIAFVEKIANTPEFSTNAALVTLGHEARRLLTGAAEPQDEAQ